MGFACKPKFYKIWFVMTPCYVVADEKFKKNRFLHPDNSELAIWAFGGFRVGCSVRAWSLLLCLSFIARSLDSMLRTAAKFCNRLRPHLLAPVRAMREVQDAGVTWAEWSAGQVWQQSDHHLLHAHFSCKKSNNTSFNADVDQTLPFFEAHVSRDKFRTDPTRMPTRTSSP